MNVTPLNAKRSRKIRLVTASHLAECKIRKLRSTARPWISLIYVTGRQSLVSFAPISFERDQRSQTRNVLQLGAVCILGTKFSPHRGFDAMRPNSIQSNLSPSLCIIQLTAAILYTSIHKRIGSHQQKFQLVLVTLLAVLNTKDQIYDTL